MLEILQHDTSLWIGLSFIALVLIIIKFAGSFIMQALDNKIADIKKEIETAENLRVEAQEMLAQYQRKQQDAEKEIQEIISNAQKHADDIRRKAEEDLKATIARKENLLAQRIERLENNAIAEIQNHAADLAIKATSEIITKTLDEKANSKLSDGSIKNISNYLN